MKTSSMILSGVVSLLVALSLGVSCADSSAVCDLADCQGQCITAGHAGGECRDNACFCTDTQPADADADVPDVIDTPPDDTSPPDVTEVADEATTPDEAVIREDAVREDYYPREDYGSTEGSEGSGSDTGGETKSGCDPLICFMSCGGTCSLGGECVCAAP
ncbi:MAG: hypothetical protein JXB32_00330 [Deltaproteobacteria bacterium]|nr:hypothetical protein [Deltaproteobacteria bacterium]